MPAPKSMKDAWDQINHGPVIFTTKDRRMFYLGAFALMSMIAQWGSEGDGDEADERFNARMDLVKEELKEYAAELSKLGGRDR